MAIFQKKRSLSDLIKELRALSDDDLAKVMEELDVGEDDDEEEGKETTEEEIEEAEEDIAEKGDDSQTEKDRIDESVAAQEEDSGEEDSQSAKDRVDESEGMEKADDESDNTEDETDDTKTDEAEKEKTDNALAARFAAIEERMESMAQTLDRLAAAVENKPFGNSRPAAPNGAGGQNGMSEDDRIMQSYYGKNYRKY